MPIYIHLSNLIINKASIQKKYTGGIKQFHLDFTIGKYNNLHEDAELFSFAYFNIDEIDISKIISKGLDFNEKLQTSSDFVIISRYGGHLWDVNWIIDNGIFAWHINTKKELISRANAIASESMDELSVKMENGENPFETIN
jgi:hypothetical protein